MIIRYRITSTDQLIPFRTVHGIQDMGKGLYVEERGRALGPYHSSNRYFRTQRAFDLERYLSDSRFCLHPMGQAESLLGFYRLLFHQLSNRERQSLRGDRNDDGKESSWERGTFQFAIIFTSTPPAATVLPLSSFSVFSLRIAGLFHAMLYHEEKETATENYWTGTPLTGTFRFPYSSIISLSSR